MSLWEICQLNSNDPEQTHSGLTQLCRVGAVAEDQSGGIASEWKR